MNQTPPLTSLTEHVTPIAVDAYAVAAAFLGDRPALALGDGRILVQDTDGTLHTHIPHPDGAILVAASDGTRVLTGGDDGHVVATMPDGTSDTLADEGGRWIDALALGSSGALAWSAGKRVAARDGKGRIARWDAPSSVRGLGFSPKGYRLACAHYNGASLWYPGTKATPDFLEWKGSHLDVTWSADGRFLVTTMQENALHGWRLAPDSGHMRMTGYPAKTRSLAWSHDGQWLATSGADAVILWPFGSKEGPTGKPPRECGVRHSHVARVAFHPHVYVLAAGYDDGAILLVRLNDGAELLVRAAMHGTGPVTALAWDRRGARLLFGTAGGAAGLLTLPA